MALNSVSRTGSVAAGLQTGHVSPCRDEPAALRGPWGPWELATRDGSGAPHAWRWGGRRLLAGLLTSFPDSWSPNSCQPQALAQLPSGGLHPPPPRSSSPGWRTCPRHGTQAVQSRRSSGASAWVWGPARGRGVHTLLSCAGAQGLHETPVLSGDAACRAVASPGAQRRQLLPPGRTQSCWDQVGTYQHDSRWGSQGNGGSRLQSPGSSERITPLRE